MIPDKVREYVGAAPTQGTRDDLPESAVDVGCVAPGDQSLAQ